MIKVYKLELQWIYPGIRPREKAIEITLTGRWKIRKVNNESTLYLEYKSINKGLLLNKKTTAWVHENKIVVAEIEEYTNECTCG